MKTLTLIRTLYTDKATFGVLIDEKQNFVCHILELPWKYNQQNLSCIPEGTYRCTYMQHDGGFRYLLHDVPDRTLIEVHSANKPSQLLGCLAPGTSFDDIENPYIINSRVALADIYERVGEEFILVVASEV